MEKKEKIVEYVYRSYLALAPRICRLETSLLLRSLE